MMDIKVNPETMKRISKEEARDKYGVVINQPGDNNIYWLIETDNDIKVVDDTDSIRYYMAKENENERN